MKKALSFLLMLCMLVSVVAPTLVFATTAEKSVTVTVGDVPVAYNEDALDLLADGNTASDATSFGNAGLVAFENKGFIHTDGVDAAVEASFEIVLDLGEVQTIGSISLSAYKETNSMIALPTVDYYVSVDGESYYQINAGNVVVPRDDAPEYAVTTLTADFFARIAVKAQYVKAVVTFQNGWLFLSELSVGDARTGAYAETPDQEHAYTMHESTSFHCIAVYDHTDGELDLSENDLSIGRSLSNSQLIKAVYDAEQDAYCIVYSKVNPWPDGHTGYETLAEGEILVSVVTYGELFPSQLYGDYDPFSAAKWIARGLSAGDWIVLNEGTLQFLTIAPTEKTPKPEPEPEEVFSYSITDGEVTITGYLGEGGDVVIPSEIEGYPVVRIGVDAFSYNDSIINVVISDGIKYIGNEAFEECHYLQSVVIPDSVISIGSWAFCWCDALTEITIPATVTSMGYQAFAASSALENIYCEAESQPEGWDVEWLDYCTATVHWGYKAEPETVYGDANGDGEINGLDVTRLMQYFASMDFDTGISDVEISEGADCNGDSVVDGRDCVRLLRYLANYNPATGESEVTLGPSK